MKITKKDLEKNQIELAIEVPTEELKPQLEKAAQRLGQKSKIPGFRPGKAPYELVKTRVGEMAIYQEALESVINSTFYQAVKQEKLITVGQPEIKVEKLAPGNPVIYVAIVTLMPEVTLGDWQAKKIDRQPIKVEATEIDQTIKQLQEMRAEEKIVDRIANHGDKLTVDFEVSVNKVIVEGGTSHKYPVILGENRMIPGFEDKLIGLKANDEIEFDLKFPDKYMQANLAGKEAHFKVKVNSVAERKMPVVNDEFAKIMGFDKIDSFKQALTDNIKKDKEIREEQRLEKTAIEQIVASAVIGELGEKLVDSEIHKMIHELEHSIQNQGMDMAGYLKSIKKTHDDLHKDFRPQAVARLKAILVLRKIGETENIKVLDREVEEEIKKQQDYYKAQDQSLPDLNTPTSRQYLTNILTHRKVIKFITDKIIN